MSIVLLLYVSKTNGKARFNERINYLIDSFRKIGSLIYHFDFLLTMFANYLTGSSAGFSGSAVLPATIFMLDFF
jgi:hypothetical protein